MIGHLRYPDTLIHKQQWKELRAEVMRDHAIDEYITPGRRGLHPGVSRRRAMAVLGVVLFLGTLVAVPWLNQRVFIPVSRPGVEHTLPATDPPPEPAAATGQSERRVARGAAPVVVGGAVEPATLDAES